MLKFMKSQRSPAQCPKPAPETAVQPGAGQGMADKAPQAQKPLVERHQSAQDRADQASLELPHERDQAADMTAARPDPLVKQAAKDLAHGLSDTSMGSEMDKAYKKLGH